MAEVGVGQRAGTVAVRTDRAIAQQQHPVDLRDDLFDMVGHQHQGDPALREAAHQAQELPAGHQVQAGGGFVQQQGLRFVHECARDQHPTHLAGGQFGHLAVRQRRCAHLFQRVARFRAHVGVDLPVRWHDEAGEEAGDHRILHPQVRHLLQVAGQVAGHQPQAVAKLVHVPAAQAEHLHRRVAFACERIQLAADQLDEG